MRYEAINVTDKDFVLDWCEPLLPDPEYAEFMEYKNSEEYQKRIPGTLNQYSPKEKLDLWVKEKKLGQLVQLQPNTINRLGGMEYKLVIPAGEGVSVCERQVNYLQRWKREKIVQKLQLGESIPKEISEGILNFKQLKEVEPESFVCTTCGEEAKSKAGLNLHMNMAHGEKIEGIGVESKIALEGTSYKRLQDKARKLIELTGKPFKVVDTKENLINNILEAAKDVRNNYILDDKGESGDTSTESE